MTDDKEVERLRGIEAERQREEATNLRHAAWDGLDKDTNEVFKAVVGMGSEAIKASMLISGGSAAALLALFSQVVKEVTLKPLLPSLLLGLALFAGALFLSSAASGIAYFAQYRFAIEISPRAKVQEHPCVTDTPASKRAMSRGERYRAISVAFVIASYCLTAFGYGLVYCGFHRYLAL
jgi:hypothetical protein